MTMNDSLIHEQQHVMASHLTPLQQFFSLVPSVPIRAFSTCDGCLPPPPPTNHQPASLASLFFTLSPNNNNNYYYNDNNSQKP